MNRPLLLLYCCAALLAAGLAGHAQETTGDAMPLSAGEALPALPANGLLDEGNIFRPEEAALLAAELADFNRRVGLPLFLVTANYIHGGTLEELGARLASEGLKDRSGLVMLYERGSGQLNFTATPGALGRSEDMKQLFLTGSKAAAAVPVTATTAQRLRAAVQALTSAGEQWKSTGTLPDPDAIPPPPLPSPAAEPETPPAPAAAPAPTPEPAGRPALPPDSAPAVPPAPGRMQRHVIAGLAAALLAGSAFMFGFHRWQERIESRTREPLYLPEVRVGRRLGAPQGGGVIAGISFKTKR